MRLDVLSVPKYRDGLTPGDDVPLAIPGVVYGVFDGATDALGSLAAGLPSGRFAALTAAKAITELAVDRERVRAMSGDDIVAHITAALAEKRAPLGLPIPPSTTAAVVFDLGDSWRFVSQGDSGFRINGTEILRHQKIIDDVSAVARCEMLRDILAAGITGDEAEQASRRGIFLGFTTAIAEGKMTESRASEIVAKTIAETKLEEVADAVRDFIMGGIQIQHQYANTSGHALCYDTLNGDLPQLGDVIDKTYAKADVKSFEIFSDGYSEAPEGVSIEAWEKGFMDAEERDYFKLDLYPGVKGSTSKAFFDDRTVVIATSL